EIYLHFRKFPKFELVGFYDQYCFIKFESPTATADALLRPTPRGILSLEAAKQAYEVPYPQPDEEGSAVSSVLHVTHLPNNYSVGEMIKIFHTFQGHVLVF